MVGSAVTWLVQTQQIGPSNLDDSVNLSLPDVIADRLAFAPGRTKIKTCDAIISGTRKVGRRLRGSSRSACIDCQSFTPNRSAPKTTKIISISPSVFQISKSGFVN